MGSRVFIWGGALLANGSERQDGSIYDPATDTWTPISTTNAPAARVGATCAWNGTVVLVFGGGDLAASQDLNTGGRYNPSTDSWQTTAVSGAPPARRRAFTAWSGTRFVVFGGENKSGAAMKDALRYDPAFDSWDPKAAGAPSGATGQATSLVGGDMLVFGGFAASELSTLDAFSVSTNAWSSPSNTNPPTARSGAFAAAAGTKWVVWGGASASTPKGDGNRYDAAGKSWLGAMSATNAPSARRIQNFRTGWALSAGAMAVAIVAGRGVSDTFEKNGGLYDVSADAWTAIPAWPSGANHEWGAAAMTDAELVVWSGLDGTTITSTGERWLRP
jgi:hypothetical protein